MLSPLRSQSNSANRIFSWKRFAVFSRYSGCGTLGQGACYNSSRSTFFTISEAGLEISAAASSLTRDSRSSSFHCVTAALCCTVRCQALELASLFSRYMCSPCCLEVFGVPRSWLARRSKNNRSPLAIANEKSASYGHWKTLPRKLYTQYPSYSESFYFS